MSLFEHQLYEYKKGVRPMVLLTLGVEERDTVLKRLEGMNVSHLTVPLGRDRVNVFFGDSICIDVIRKMGKSSLTELTPEEDFILGTLLGYDVNQQCQRYLSELWMDRRRVS